MNVFSHQRRTTRRRQRGINLVELMISMAIGLFLLAGLVGVFVNSSQTSAELSKSAQQVESGRFAMQVLADDIAHAGFFGYYVFSGAATATDPCATSAAALTTGMQMPLFGAKGASSLWPLSIANTCAALTSANRKADTAVLVIRRAETRATASGSFVAGEMYVQTRADPDSPPVLAAATAAAGTIGAGGTFPQKLKDNTTDAPVRRVRTHIYFVSPCSKPLVCTGGSGEDSIPTLKRIELSGGYSAVVPIAEGIENLQFLYGVDADGDGAPESPFVDEPGTAAAWANVVAVQVFVLARNVEKSGGHNDTKRYYLGSTTPVGPMNDAYKRHAYSALVRVVNTSQRREVP